MIVALTLYHLVRFGFCADVSIAKSKIRHRGSMVGQSNCLTKLRRCPKSYISTISTHYLVQNGGELSKITLDVTFRDL